MAQPVLIAPARYRQDALGGVRRVAFLLSCLLLAAVGTMAAPLAISIGYGEPETIKAFATTMFIGAAIGTVGLFALTQRPLRPHAAARASRWWRWAGSWCAPSGLFPTCSDGILEPARRVVRVRQRLHRHRLERDPRRGGLPRGILFWRCFTHWLGAMGFLVAFVALFPLLGVGAMQLYKAEAPGLEVDRLRPRLSSTARALWIVYLLLSVALTLLLLAGGMDWYDALCQMFGAIGTGGFSTKNTSIAWWHSAYIEWVIVLFLWVSSTNFSLWWAVLGGRFAHPAPRRGVALLHDRAHGLELLHRGARVGDLDGLGQPRPSATPSSPSSRSRRRRGS